MKYRVSIRVFSEQLTIDKLNALIGMECDNKKEIGEPRGKGLKVGFKENIWIIQSKMDENTTLDVQIKELLKRLAPVKIRLKEISSKCDIVCQCVIEWDESPELNFPKSILEGLAEIGAELDIDSYPL